MDTSSPIDVIDVFMDWNKTYDTLVAQYNATDLNTSPYVQ